MPASMITEGTGANGLGCATDPTIGACVWLSPIPSPSATGVSYDGRLDPGHGLPWGRADGPSPHSNVTVFGQAMVASATERSRGWGRKRWSDQQAFL